MLPGWNVAGLGDGGGGARRATESHAANRQSGQIDMKSVSSGTSGQSAGELECTVGSNSGRRGRACAWRRARARAFVRRATRPATFVAEAAIAPSLVMLSFSNLAVRSRSPRARSARLDGPFSKAADPFSNSASRSSKSTDAFPNLADAFSQAADAFSNSARAGPLSRARPRRPGARGRDRVVDLRAHRR